VKINMICYLIRENKIHPQATETETDPKYSLGSSRPNKSDQAVFCWEIVFYGNPLNLKLIV
jgi:hypothetical protein